MVSYRLDSSTRRPATDLTPATPGSAHQNINECVVDTRPLVNQQRHAVIIHDASGSVVFRNAALVARMPGSNGYQESPIDAETWVTVCESISKIVRDTLVAGDTEVSAVIPINQRAFVAVGSVLKQPTGNVIGVVTNVAEINPQQISTQHSDSHTVPVAGSAQGTMQEGEFQNWLGKRESARQKMARLSKREVEVVSLVSHGLPNKSIARELDISVKTIEKHRANAVRKLGVCSTAEMVRIAVVADQAQQAPTGTDASATVAGPRSTVSDINRLR